MTLGPMPQGQAHVQMLLAIFSPPKARGAHPFCGQSAAAHHPRRKYARRLQTWQTPAHGGNASMRGPVGGCTGGGGVGGIGNGIPAAPVAVGRASGGRATCEIRAR